MVTQTPWSILTIFYQVSFLDQKLPWPILQSEIYFCFHITVCCNSQTSVSESLGTLNSLTGMLVLCIQRSPTEQPLLTWPVWAVAAAAFHWVFSYCTEDFSLDTSQASASSSLTQCGAAHMLARRSPAWSPGQQMPSWLWQHTNPQHKVQCKIYFSLKAKRIPQFRFT